MAKHTHCTSEVAQLRQQMERECEAMHLALKGTAIVARHDIISHRHRILDNYQGQLERFVGYQQALQISLEIYDQATARHQPGSP